MKTRADYERAFGVVRRVIAEWDPYSLIAGGAPNDEYDHEVALVTAAVSKLTSPEAAVQLLSEVFSRQFEAEHFGTPKCQQAGFTLYERLRVAGLLGQASPCQ